MTKPSKEYYLVSAILSDHESRIWDMPVRNFKKSEVIVQLSLMEVAQRDEKADPDPKTIGAGLSNLGYRFITVRGTYKKARETTLIRDTRGALSQALRRCPDREYEPLVLSVLERRKTPRM